jgi:hypothetical protein
MVRRRVGNRWRTASSWARRLDSVPRGASRREDHGARSAAVAGELDAGAIVLGARGLGRVESTLLGSVSSAVVHNARRPTLVVPHPDWPTAFAQRRVAQLPGATGACDPEERASAGL